MEILSCLRPKNVRGLVALFIYKLQQIYSRFRKLRIQLKDHNESFIFHEKKNQIALLLLLCCILSSYVGISFLEFVNFKRKRRHVVCIRIDDTSFSVNLSLVLFGVQC